MTKTIIAILVAVVTIVLTIAVILGTLFLIVFGGLYVWGRISRRRPEPGQQQPSNPASPTLPRTRREHTDAVTAVAFDPSGDWLASVSRDRTLHLGSLKWEGSEHVLPAFYPGPVAVGHSDRNGTRVATGRFRREDEDSAAEPDIEIWRNADFREPSVQISVPDIRRVLALTFDVEADKLTALVSLRDSKMDERRRRLRVFEYDLRPVGNIYSPAEYDVSDGVPIYDGQEAVAALSATGRYVGCRTKYTDETGAVSYGVGVWDVAEEKWKHRFGGREAMPHMIFAVTSDGETVFSGREDDPGRDHKFGGSEWYDGLYVWDAANALPEGAEEAKPEPGMYGSRGMALSRDEKLFATPLGEAGALTVYDRERREQTQTFRRPQPESENNRWGNNVWCVAFAPDGKTVVTGHADGEIWAWGLPDRAADL